jgi:hypothetical protein
MSEVVVGRFEDEIEAEAAAGLLRSRDIDARVSYRATMGLPRPMAPLRVVAPFGAYEIVVPQAQVGEAQDALREAGGPSPRPTRYRWLALLLIAVFLFPYLWDVVAAFLAASRR